MSTLYYGDNLDVLRRHLHDETVDLIYLDPPFQSGRDYNVLFEEQDGTKAAAQIQRGTVPVALSPRKLRGNVRKADGTAIFQV
jgi:16S rRNA G966 N2-methylase RsmD